MAVRVAINGLGRIGRCFLRAAWHDPQVEIVAVIDRGKLDTLAYLLKYDSVYGRMGAPVEEANIPAAATGRLIWRRRAGGLLLPQGAPAPVPQGGPNGPTGAAPSVPGWPRTGRRRGGPGRA